MIGVMENKKLSYKKAQSELTKRDPYMGVVLEKLNDKMELLLEGHEVAQKRIDRLDGRMGRVEAKLDNVEVKVGVLEEKFDDLAKDVRKKFDNEDIVSLGHRVTKLEAA